MTIQESTRSFTETLISLYENELFSWSDLIFIAHKEHRAFINRNSLMKCKTHVGAKYYADKYHHKGWMTIKGDNEGNHAKFIDFLREVGLAPHPSYEIDRINNNLGYIPGNLRWVPKKVNLRNNRRAVIDVESGKHLKQIAEETGIDYYVLYYRWKRGLDLKTGMKKNQIINK